jgi:hypothetical protein
MKLAITFLLGIAVLPVCNLAAAADWAPLGKTGAVDQYFYDRSKLTIKEDQITYWKKVIFAAPQVINGKEVASGLLRERIDCAEHTAKLISYLYYATTGDTVEYIAKDESEAAPIIPDTVGDAFEQKLCPMVWRKQEEARIKAEQKAAEAELSAMKKPPVTPEKPAAGATGTGTTPSVRLPPSPAVAPNPAPSIAPTPGQTPPDPNAAPVTPAPGTTAAPGQTPPDPNAAPVPRQPLPMPQIIEQLY